MIKRRRPEPDLRFEPIVVGNVHRMKERSYKVVITKCGVIADDSGKQAVRTTNWNDVTCPDCLKVLGYLQRA